MKTKTSISLSAPLLVQIDKLIGAGASRSAYIEKVLGEHLQDADWCALQNRDTERINATAGDLNAEALDVLSYQAPFS